MFRGWYDEDGSRAFGVMAVGPGRPRRSLARRWGASAAQDRDGARPRGHQAADPAHRRKERLAAHPGGDGDARKQGSHDECHRGEADTLDHRAWCGAWAWSAPLERDWDVWRAAIGAGDGAIRAWHGPAV